MAELKSAPGHDPNSGYETSDVNLRPILIAGVSLAVIVIVSVIAMNLLYRYLSNQSASVDQPLPPLASPEQIPPGPRLEVSSAQGLRQLQAREDELLQQYGWVDQEAEIVHIPIERAMELILERGLPTRGED